MPNNRSYKLGAVAPTKSNRARDVPGGHWLVVAKLKTQPGGQPQKADLLLFSRREDAQAVAQHLLAPPGDLYNIDDDVHVQRTAVHGHVHVRC